MEKHLDTIHWEYDNCKFIKRGDLKKNIKKKGLGQRESAILTLKFLYDLWRNRLELIWCSNTTFRSHICPFLGYREAFFINLTILASFPKISSFLSNSPKKGSGAAFLLYFPSTGGHQPISYFFCQKPLGGHRQPLFCSLCETNPLGLQNQRELARAVFFQRLQLTL